MERQMAGRHRAGGRRSGERNDQKSNRLVQLARRMAPALRTVKGAILTAGALAVAVGAIWALFPRQESPEVRFESVDRSPAYVPLSKFRPTEGKFAPTAHNLGPESKLDSIAVVQIGPMATVTASTVDGATGTATTAPATTAPTGSSTTATATGTTNVTTSSEPTTATSSLSPSTGPKGPYTVPNLTNRYLSDVFNRVRAAGYQVDDDQPQIRPMFARGYPLGPGGKQLPAKEAAKRVVQTLSHVRTKDSGKKKEPLGLELTVQIKLRHVRDEPVWIFWEMRGAGSQTETMDDAWLGNMPAYTLRATDDDDTGVFKLWIPLPKEKGDYAVSLEAWTNQTELPDASISTSLFH
jgi:hypothetical protein